MVSVRLPSRLLAALAFAVVTACASAQDRPTLDAALRERVISVTKPGFWAATLEVTLFSPPGDGPFPVAVINHGKAAGDPRWQAGGAGQGYRTATGQSVAHLEDDVALRAGGAST